MIKRQKVLLFSLRKNERITEAIELFRFVVFNDFPVIFLDLKLPR